MAERSRRAGSRARVRTFLEERGLDDGLFEFEVPTKTAQQAADAIGCVSPFDLPAELPVLIDDLLARFDVVYPAAGTPSSVVRMRREDLLGVFGGRVGRISCG